MWEAISRWWKVRFASIEALIDEDTEGRSMDPYVIRVRYKEIIAVRNKRVAQFRDGVGKTAAIQIGTQRALGVAKEALEKAEKAAKGYLAIAQKKADELKAAGKTPDEIRADADFMQARSGFEAKNAAANERKAEVARLEAQLKKDTETVNKLQVQLTAEHRKLGDLEREAATSEARAAAAKARQDAANLITGLSSDPTVKDHASLLKSLDNMEANAEVTERLAGTDSALKDEEAIRALEARDSANEFDNLIGLAASSDAPVTAKPADDRVRE